MGKGVILVKGAIMGAILDLFSFLFIRNLRMRLFLGKVQTARTRIRGIIRLN